MKILITKKKSTSNRKISLKRWNRRKR